MTENQLAYLQYEETARSNAAREAETNRSNLAREAETNRANLANETETIRSNKARETETNRANVARETETNRANLVDEAERERSNMQREALTRIGHELQARSIRVDQDKAKEQARHNEFMEGVAVSSEGRGWFDSFSNHMKNLSSAGNTLISALKFVGG